MNFRFINFEKNVVYVPYLLYIVAKLNNKNIDKGCVAKTT